MTADASGTEPGGEAEEDHSRASDRNDKRDASASDLPTEPGSDAASAGASSKPTTASLTIQSDPIDEYGATSGSIRMATGESTNSGNSGDITLGSGWPGGLPTEKANGEQQLVMAAAEGHGARR